MELEDVEERLAKLSKDLVTVRMPCNPLVGVVPQQLSRFNLTHLNMSLCGLREVSFFDQGTCPNLRILNLSWNRLADVQPLCGLAQLRELDLTGNWIKVVPPSLAQLKELTKLHLSNNQLTRAVDLTALSKLAFVSFARNSVLPRDCGGVCDTLATTRVLLGRLARHYWADMAVYTFVLCWKNRHLSEDEHQLLQRLPRDMARYLVMTMWKLR